MRAVLISEPTKYLLTDLPRPKCSTGQVLIQTAHCGICGTDLEILRGTLGHDYVRYPVVPGHEWTGIVVETAPDVTSLTGGDRVSVIGYLACHHCPHCLAGEINLCEAHEQIGFTHNGGFAEYVAAPAESCHQLPEHIGLDEAVLIEPAATVVRAIDRSRPKPGFSSAVIGCGPIGQIAIRVLGLYKPSALLAIDRSELQRIPALHAGATAFTAGAEPGGLVRESGAEGWDVVVSCAGGNQAAELALAIARRGGHVILIGGAPVGQLMSCPANVFVMKDLKVNGFCGYTTESWVQTIDLLSSGTLRLGDLITHRVPLEKFDQATNLLQSRTEPLGKVIVSYL